MTSTDVRTDENCFSDFFIVGVHFLGETEIFFLEKTGTLGDSEDSVCLPHTSGGMYSQNKHDRHTDSHFRLLEDNSPRDGRGSYDQGSHDEGVEKHSCHIELRGTHLNLVTRGLRTG